MRIADMLARGRPTVSFEFMAPRDESEVDLLEKTIAALAGNAPDWVSVTYRRATGDKTLELVTRIKRQYHLEAMAHLTCANTKDETRRHLNWMEREGVANVLALRGDPPGPGLPFEPVDPGLAHGSDLVAFLRSCGYRFGTGATLPHGLAAAIEAAPDDDAVRAIGVQHCIAQCEELLAVGVPGLHFYTFNRARAPMEILASLRGRQLLTA